MLVAAVALLLAITVLITRAIVRPLMHARSLAQAIEGGQLGHETVVTGNDEFADTLSALNAMDQRLASIVTDVRDIAIAGRFQPPGATGCALRLCRMALPREIPGISTYRSTSQLMP